MSNVSPHQACTIIPEILLLRVRQEVIGHCPFHDETRAENLSQAILSQEPPCNTKAAQAQSAMAQKLAETVPPGVPRSQEAAL